jgi:predicted lipoprotein with Yx(FWY)xxD motif
MVRMMVAAAAAALLAGCSSIGSMYDSATQSAPAKTSAGVLVGASDMTLYTFDRDPAGTGRSVCNGPCATNWPPLFADGGTAKGDWTIVRRDDGRTQWAYKGKPLYYWAKDQKPGDRTGDGFNGVWRVARP